MLILIILLLLVFTSGQIHFLGIYFCWTNVISCVMFKNYPIWIGTREQYAVKIKKETEFLEKMKNELDKKIKEKRK
jgi:hypothetical protein